MDGQVSFTDIIRRSVLESFSNYIDPIRIIITLAVAFVVGLFIYYLYKKVFSGVLYSKSFNISLIAMTLVTAVVILAVNSNLILSLGMVGALSIVRFRTPIKDPMDLVFLFWAAAAGIVTGAGFFVLAVLGSVVVGLVLYLFNKNGAFESPYLLVVHCDGDASEQQTMELVAQQAKRHSLRQKNVSAGNIELTLEVRMKGSESSLVNAISALDGVKHAVLISYNGDYVS